ncbi:hypothetical protein DICVIV_14416 [Dictyocaulus viviparus]|uniref:Uncharacterized protein n=1 Tax=Dictyocaulus viviparus TaxID=29172 RepID=A0A0D8X7V5_DICVI|nr:hypothetical protein DICVIV_14416 [Dictyocaulus viviparus]
MAAARLEEVENRQRTLLANTDNRFSEGIDPVLSLRHSIAAIDARLSSNKATEEEKTDLEKLAKDLRIFLTGLPDDVRFHEIIYIHHTTCRTFLFI